MSNIDGFFFFFAAKSNRLWPLAHQFLLGRVFDVKRTDVTFLDPIFSMW